MYRLGRGWEAGATFRLVSGNLDTPVIGSNLNVVTGNYTRAVRRDRTSTRNPLFHRLDVRVEKQWKWPAWKLALYLDVQNIYNAESREGTHVRLRVSRSARTSRGLPIIPNLGLRGEI